MNLITTNLFFIKKPFIALLTGLLLLLINTSVLAQAIPADPTSNSPQCAAPGVTMNFTGSAPAGETWYWQTSAEGTSTANSASSNVVNVSGTYYLRSQDNGTLAWSAGAGSVTITITPDVTTPVFTLGATSTRCLGSGNVNYSASASNNTGLVYSLDAASLAAGLTINAANGLVNYTTAWIGTSIITATASGCNGPTTATHSAISTLTIGTPVFALGATSTRCFAAGTITYTATASNSTAITYSLDATSLSWGNTINITTGAVTYWTLWIGTSTITATATGCGGPKTATHTVNIIGGVGTPVFTLGSTSSRCTGAGTVSYAATAANSTVITYSLDAASLAEGNTINPAAGDVTFDAAWTGTSVITATATGCYGPKTANHTVTTHGILGATSFTGGATSVRCQGAATVTYTANAVNNQGFTYTLDATTDAFPGNSINTTTGSVTYAAGWSGTSTITATATGCGGPATATHVVTITATVGNPVFALGTTSVRCQGAGNVTYTATATTNTGITYSLDAASITGGNTFNTATGEVTYVATWTGTSIITVTVTGCGGPKTTNHTVTISPTVGTPAFSVGATTTRCQGAGTVTYTATATSNTGITYVLDAVTNTFPGNSINTTTGAVTYSAGWSGTSIITVTATGCNGPSTATHTVTITPTVGIPVFTLGATSTRCQGAGVVNYSASAPNSTGITYSLNSAAVTAGNTIHSLTGNVTYVAGWTGSTIITASAAGCNGPVTATHSVTITPSVGTPVFTQGPISVRCQVAGTLTFTATATNNTGITYSLDATSLAAGNTINAATGAVTFVPSWFGPSTISANATGCNSTSTASTISDTRDPVQIPVFAAGSSTIRCKGSGTVNYSATATNALTISYSINAASIAAGVTINASTGDVTYPNGWVGNTLITASASGCTGPKTAIHTAATYDAVTTPVFALGNSSTICQASGTFNYTATSSYATSMTFSLDAASLAAGNTINPTTGDVTYAPTWSGSTTVMASAAGCGGPKTKTHSVTITPTVGTPVFSTGATSTRCQGGGNTNYSASTPNSTSRLYTLDATSAAFPGNSINSSSGIVNYSAAWSGTSIISVTADGCNGPSVAVTHTAITTPYVGTPVFPMGANSTRCQGAASVSYAATASNSASIVYSIDGLSISGGCSINTSTGLLAFAPGWVGNTTITALAQGCNGPMAAMHVVTSTATIGNPVFTLGATSTRCIGAGTVTYTATSTLSTGMSYSLDAASQTAGNTINTATGAVTYLAGWAGPTVITATATGCSGPKSSTHTVTIMPTVGTPVFALGATSIRCQGASFLAYSATASSATSIIYSIDAASVTGGNSINSTTGNLSFAAGWSGTTIVTATATGCNGPATATHTITITITVGTPVFTGGSASTRCQGAGLVTYTANASASTGITYSLDVSSVNGGNVINSVTGEVTYLPAWSGTTTITASATGCNGPKTAIHVVSITPSVSIPVFNLGAQTVRDQGAATISYTATALNSTSVNYILDAASLAAGNTINASTGAVTWTAGWYGTSAITATATGCNTPTQSSHIVTINTTLVQTPLYLSDPGQLLDRVDPVAANIIPTAVSYPISAGLAGIIIDANSLGNGIITPLTVSHTTGNGGNRLMLVGISQKNKTVLGVTYGGTPLTLVGENNTNGNARIALYMMLNPPSGTATVVVTFNAAPDKGAVVSVTTYNGVHQTNPLGTFVTAESKDNTPTVNVAAATGDLVYDVVSVRNAPVTVGPGQTQHWNVFTTKEIYGAGSISPGAASITMNWTTINQDWSIGAVAIKPAPSINNISFTQAPVLCSPLIIKAQAIQMLVHINVTGGTMPVNPAITAALQWAGTNTVISLSNPVYNSAAKILSWTGALGADVTIPTGQALQLKFTTAQAGVEFQIEYHSKTKPSRISLLPVSTFVDFVSFKVYDTPYPNGRERVSGSINQNFYVRAVVTTPFGYSDITGMDIKINPPGNVVPVNCVDSSTCTRTYEYPWTTPATTGTYYMLGTAKEGFENLIKNSDLEPFDVCTFCPPVASTDSATGAGGAPLVVDVLANDYDPNNNIRISTLSIVSQPNNGSAFITNNKIVYLPNGSYAGRDTMVYRICDSTGLCANAQVYFTINPLVVDPCSEATQSSVYYIPFSENEARTALSRSASSSIPSSNIRTVISLKMPYPGMVIIWDEWEDGYELNALNPLQTTTRVWGDGNPYNGIVPGYSNDIIPPGGSIVLDNTIPVNPRVSSNLFYDGRDKITASGQITVTQVCGEPSIMQVQCMKTNVSPVKDFGTSFTIPAGENFNSRDFRYTSLFIRASQDSTEVIIDKDNNGSLETTAIINQGQVLFVDGGVLSGATIAASAPIGLDLHLGGVDGYSSRDVPIYPASWYSHTYYSPVPTTGRTSTATRDTAAVMLYNSLNRPITINWSSGVPSSGSVNLPAKSVVRLPLAYSQTAAYKFVNPTGESFTAIQICDSYSPGGGGNSGTEFDWSFNLISENRLTDLATIAWAPGSINGSRNDNPIWVTPTANTTIYVKYNGNIGGNTGLVSPCGFRYDVAYPLTVLNHKRLLDAGDNDQSGLAVFTCDGTKLAAVYGEDPSTATTANPSWDVGSTIQPFCKQKLIFANDDYGRTMVNQPVTIPILINDFGFLAIIDPGSVVTTGLLQPKHGRVTVNANGTVLYTPDSTYVGKDTFEYRVCSTPSPVVCDNALVYIDISTCPAPFNQNVIMGTVFNDKNDDGTNNDGGTGVPGAKVYLYVDANCNTVIDTNELKDSVTVDMSGTYQFITYPEKFVEDDFENGSGGRSCANGTDGNATWLSDWVDAGDESVGFCNTSKAEDKTDCDMYKDAGFSFGIRLKDNNVSATRTANLSGAAYAFLSFDYRRKSATMTAGRDVIVQASGDGSSFGTVFTIAGDGNIDTAYVSIYNQDISSYTVATSTTYIRFLTNNSMGERDTVYIDNVKIQYIRYPQCYITRLNATTVPAYHHTTTVLQHNFTATSAQTCLSPYDFGISKNKTTISGALFQDANGLIDNLVNGTAIGKVSGATVYAYLVDSTGKVVRKTTLNATTGAYSFTNADVFTNYHLCLSINNLNQGDLAPSDAGITGASGNWAHTGDSYGINNLAGSGIKSGPARCAVDVTTGLVNVTNVNFGVERLPDSDNRNIVYTTNMPDVQYDVTGGLTGSDPEDGVLGSAKTYKITTLPYAAVLFYNGAAVTLNQVITNFNPALLMIDPDDDTYSAFFRFAAMDAAGLYDASPATVTVSWNMTLPVRLISFSGRLNGSKVDLNWVTASELNTKHFEVERSPDGQNFTRIATVDARGTTANVTVYDLSDPAPYKGINYYRLKIVDFDGKFEYSQIVIIRIENNVQLVTKVAPNPFTGKVDVYLTLTHNTNVQFKFIDVNGKLVFNKSVKGLKGFNWFTINDLDKLPAAPYFLHISTDDAIIVEKLLKQ